VRRSGLADLLAARRRARRKPATVVADTGSLAEELDAVALGQYVMITVAGAGRYAPRPGVRIVPIHDIPGSESTVRMARRPRDRARPRVRRHGTRGPRPRTELIARIERGE